MNVYFFFFFFFYSLHFSFMISQSFGSTRSTETKENCIFYLGFLRIYVWKQNVYLFPVCNFIFFVIVQWCERKVMYNATHHIASHRNASHNKCESLATKSRWTFSRRKGHQLNKSTCLICSFSRSCASLDVASMKTKIRIESSGTLLF